VAGSCEHGNEPFGSIKGRELLDQLSNYQSLRKDSVPKSKFLFWIVVFWVDTT
jgi:hypothetical protein